MNRFPLNVPGSFYTTGQKDDQGNWHNDCLDCGMPEQEAPHLFPEMSDERQNTYFIKQPETPEEIEQAICAAQVCCVGAIRYGGKDKSIISKMQKAECDYKINFWGKVVPNNKQWWKFW